MAAQQPTIHDIVESLEEGDEFKVHAGEFIVDEIIAMEARPIVYVRKKSIGGWMQTQYRMEWANPADEDDETLVIRTKRKSHWDEWSRFEPERVELDGDDDAIVETEDGKTVAADGGVVESGNQTEREEKIEKAEQLAKEIRSLMVPEHTADACSNDFHDRLDNAQSELEFAIEKEKKNARQPRRSEPADFGGGESTGVQDLR